MATDLTMDKTAVVSKGGQRFAYKRVTSAGGETTPPDTWHDGVYREKSDFSFSQPDTNIYDEKGDLIQTELGDMDMAFEITSLQDDANLITFLKDETASAYFSIFVERGKMQTTKIQEVFFPITRIERSYSSSAPGRRPVIKITPIQNLTAVSPTTVPTWAECTTTGSWTTAIGNYFTVIDTTES